MLLVKVPAKQFVNYRRTLPEANSQDLAVTILRFDRSANGDLHVATEATILVLESGLTFCELVVLIHKFHYRAHP